MKSLFSAVDSTILI